MRRDEWYVWVVISVGLFAALVVYLLLHPPHAVPVQTTGVITITDKAAGVDGGYAYCLIYAIDEVYTCDPKLYGRLFKGRHYDIAVELRGLDMHIVRANEYGATPEQP